MIRVTDVDGLDEVIILAREWLAGTEIDGRAEIRRVVDGVAKECEQSISCAARPQRYLCVKGLAAVLNQARPRSAMVGSDKHRWASRSTESGVGTTAVEIDDRNTAVQYGPNRTFPAAFGLGYRV